MSSSAVESRASATHVRITGDSLRVELADGRIILVPIDWYPRLANATRSELAKWELTGRGEGIHWPVLDEDISIEGLLAGRRSRESKESLRRWLKGRQPRVASR
jgi:hypothetical protein